MASRRQCLAVLVGFAVLLFLSAPLSRFEGSKYTQPIRDLLAANALPTANAVPSEAQRVALGSSDVWDREVLAASDSWLAAPELQRTANEVFLLLKTGAETIWSRLPVHFDTTLKHFPQNAIYSDMASRVNGHIVWDALQYLPAWLLNSKSLAGYRVRRTNVEDHWGWSPAKLNIEGDGGGWETDRFKNLPAFLHAWQMTRGELPWYFMIDGDTYVAASTLANVTSGRDPDLIWYLGKGVGMSPVFAHGGSGILLSRGTMRAMFHEPTDLDWHMQILSDTAKIVKGHCCGDEAVANEFQRLTNNNSATHLERHEHGSFQGQTIAGMRLHKDAWCSPVGTFHHVTAAEVQRLFDWENVAMARKAARGDAAPLLYIDFYEDFVEPFITEYKRGWIFEGLNDDEIVFEYTPSAAVDLWDDATRLNVTGTEADCRRACALREDCLAWDWHKDRRCRVFTGEFSLGKALNEYHLDFLPTDTEFSLGHMVDRIKALHHSLPCRTAAADAPPREPGWYYAETHRDWVEGALLRELETRPTYLETMNDTSSG